MNPSVQQKWVYATLGLFSVAALVALAPSIFRTQGMMPHGFCITWQPDLIALHAVSDVLIGLAYLTIPVTLLYFVRRRADLPFRGIFLLFGLFIVSCGMTHFIEVLTLWQPYYWLSGAVKAITAIASIATAIVLITLIKPALALPSPSQLRVATANLEAEVSQRRRVEAELRLSQTQLENRVAERTRELEAARMETEEARSLLDTFFEQTPVGLGMWDHQLRFLRVNRQLAEINGIPAAAHAGKRIDALLPQVGPDVVPLMNRVLETGLPLVGVEVSGYTPQRPDQLRTWRTNFFPIWLKDGLDAIGATCEDVTATKVIEKERNELLAAERAAREAAERANRLKDQFLAVVSHELRNPVNAIVGWVNVVRDGKPTGEQLGDALERIERNALTQARLVDDLLDVSRIMTGNLNLIRRTVDVGTVVLAAVDALRPNADAKGITVSIAEPGERQFCEGDSDRLQQVVSNLVGNAIKFTPQSGRVAIRMTTLGSEIVIEVSDNGPGIDPQFLPHVFEPFRQADGTSTRRHQGLGLGLSIARDLVLLHGGRVEAGNVDTGGAIFRVYLPSTTGADVDAPAAGDRVGGRLDSVRILIVEDNLDTLEMLTRILKIAGAVVHPCSNVADAMAVALKHDIDIVVTDIGMPDEDGYVLLQRLRSLKGQIPAIAVTAFATAVDRARSTEAGFQRHFSKPFKPDELIQAIRALASNSSR